MRFLTEDENEVLGRLLRRISVNQARNKLRHDYNEGEHLLTKLGFSIPDGMESFKTPLGWPRKAVTVFASHLVPNGYKGEESQLLTELDRLVGDARFQMLEQMAIEAACRYGTSFTFTTHGDTSIGEPEIIVSVKTAMEATCELDLRSWRVKYALEMVGRREWNLYFPGYVLSGRKHGGRWVVEEHDSPLTIPCAPYTHGALADKPFGTSRITRPLMGFTDAGVRTLLRQEVSAEFYSAPRQALLGADEAMFKDKNGRLRPGWAAIIGGIWGIPDLLDEEGNPDTDSRPEFHNLPQMTMQPFNDQFRMIAQQVSGETSIPVSYLGVVADSNPTSAQAIKANKLDLLQEVGIQQLSFNMGRMLLARNLLTVALGAEFGDLERRTLQLIKPDWVSQDVRSVQEQSQYVAEQVRVGNFQAGAESTLRQLPINADDVALFVSDAKKAQGKLMFEKIIAEAAQRDTSSEPVGV